MKKKNQWCHIFKNGGSNPYYVWEEGKNIMDQTTEGSEICPCICQQGMNGIDMSITKYRNVPSINLAETTNHLNHSATRKIPSFTESCQAGGFPGDPTRGKS